MPPSEEVIKKHSWARQKQELTSSDSKMICLYLYMYPFTYANSCIFMDTYAHVPPT